ncbi:MAG TPA: hypothetical protein VGJ94_16375 [Syntrophorhabdaceae bacterium]|jgi:hypothetical protein
MFVRSTGLGRTLLRGRIAAIESTTMVPSTLEPPADGMHEPMRMLMVMEILHPVHWTVRAFVDPADLRQMVWMVVKNPALIFRGIRFFFKKTPVYPRYESGETQAGAAVPTNRPIEVPARPKTGPGPIPGARPGPGPIPSRRVTR